MVLAAVFGLSALLSAVPVESLRGARPNIVLIMPDDVSYGSIGAYGGTKPSPNIDTLYRRGFRFEDFHVSPTCSPTRAALLTGRHECYAGVTHTIKMRDRLSLKSRTVADMLKAAGYTTGIFGKWHLGDEEAYRPDKRGFDEVYIHGAGGIGQNYTHSADFPNNDYNNPVLYHNGKVIETKGFCTDLFFDQGIRWIEEQQKRKKPFFCYIPLNVNHGPKIPPILLDGSKGDSMINLDRNVGKMMRFLHNTGLSKNTLLIYMTDNGANSGNKKLRGGKGSPYEGGTRVPCIMYWRGKMEGGVSCDYLSGHIDFFPTFAELAGSTEPAPGDKKWDGRSLLPFMADPTATGPERYWISHKTRWGEAAAAKYSNCAIRDARYKLVMLKAGKSELYDLVEDVHEKNDILAQHPGIAEKLKAEYDAWWEDIQPYLVNDHLKDVPETCKPYHELYREQFGQTKFEAAMKLMTWAGGKPYGKKRGKKPAPHAKAAPREPQAPTKDGTVSITAETATLVGKGFFRHPERGDIARWTNATDKLVWQLKGAKPGRYTVEITYGSAPSGNPFRLTAGEASLEAKTKATGSWGKYETVSLGSIQISGDQTTITLAPIEKPKSGLMNFRSMRLIPE